MIFYPHRQSPPLLKSGRFQRLFEKLLAVILMELLPPLIPPIYWGETRKSGSLPFIRGGLGWGKKYLIPTRGLFKHPLSRG
jgi:hypothetical protein